MWPPFGNSHRVRPIVIAAALIFLANCADDVLTPVQSPVVQEGIHGAVQKGPFLGGMRVTIQELDTALDPTGISFEAVTHNDRGEYVLDSDLRSRHIEVIATGTYFDEVHGGISQTPITLRALSDVTSDSRINVNLLTTLERDRIRQLVRDQEIPFEAAERQAQGEILALVGGAPPQLVPADDLDMTVGSEANAIFLAASLDLQGTLTGSALAQWLSTLNAALLAARADEDQSIAAQLLRNASLLRLDWIRSGLQRRYAEAGASVTLPPFEIYTKRIVPLSVVGVFPADGSERVAFTSAISVSFNQEIRAETLTPTTFVVESDAGPVSGHVTYAEPGWLATFVPTEPLAPSTEFRVRVLPEVTALSGRTLEAVKSWGFGTERLDLVSNLVAHYPFDGDGRDVSGNGNHAETIKTAPAPDRHGEDGKALRLQFSYVSPSSMIRIPQPFPFTAQPWTYCIWFRIDNTLIRTHSYLLSSSNVGLADDKQLTVDANTHQLYSSLEQSHTLYTGVIVADETWYQAVLVHAQNRVRIYVNGAKKHDSANTFKTAYSDTSAWAIGKELDYPHWGAVQGVVDDVRIYARELNDVEIVTLYRETAP